MKDFNGKVFMSASMVTGLLVVISMLARLEGGSAETAGLPVRILSGLFNVLRFPTHTLAGDFADSNNIVFFVGLLCNCLFYGLLYERIRYFIREKRNQP
ncbi:MAG: hypothetical protein EOO09_17030 [Chitinophagaceae bacterium]|nr:MAG: hypothetical protein EOO09_17030 [Chitinophagaceae bacterium]